MSAKAKIILLITVLILCIGMVVYGTIADGSSIREHLPRLILMILTAIIVIVRLLSALRERKPLNKEALKADMAEAKEWIVAALNSSGYQADFSMESLKEIDRFLDEEKKENGILSQNIGRILFALGVYVGETILLNLGGEWTLDNCESEMHISFKVDEETLLFPVTRVMARYEYGIANSIYVYGQRAKKSEE